MDTKEGQNYLPEEEETLELYLDEMDIEKDLQNFYRNYEKLKVTYKTSPVLSKYEKTRILSERAQQLANGSISYLKNPETYNTIYDIALNELSQKKLPFIIKRKMANSVEYWKLEDLKIL
tara:strand:+ start:34 stop:393 length:360 start_codon:yes stop_codon:yes gene_type:complete